METSSKRGRRHRFGKTFVALVPQLPLRYDHASLRQPAPVVDLVQGIVHGRTVVGRAYDVENTLLVGLLIVI